MEKGISVKKQVDKLFSNDIAFPFIALVVILMIFSVMTGGRIFRPSNIANIVILAFPTMIASIGAVFIYSHGGLDFSIGAVQGIGIMVLGLVLNGKMDNIVWGILACIGVSILCGVAVAFLRTVLRLPAIIASLCIQSIAKGILQAMVTSRNITLPIGLVKLDVAWLKILIMVLLLIFATVVFEKTAIGKGNKAMGGNMLATRLMGVNTDMMIFFAHILTNFAVGVAAVFTASQISQVTATTGFGLEMDVLVAAVIGGMDINGGPKSKIINILVGAVIVAVMINGFLLWGVDPNVIQGLKGAIFLFILFITKNRNKN